MSTHTRLNVIMPKWNYHEVHRTTVTAPPDRVFASIKKVTPREMPIMRLLMALRDIPARLSMNETLKTPLDRPLHDIMLDNGFTVLDEIQDSELVFGDIAQFWKLTSFETVPIDNADEFIRFITPLYAKAAFNLHVEPSGEKTILSTETRISCTCDEARRKFGRYWHVIRLGSGLIRREWLAAIKRRAEA